MSGWTIAADLRAQARRLWDRGRLPAWLVDSGGAFPLRLALRCPTSADCTERFDEVRAWSQALQRDAQPGLRLAMREWRHPVLGRNELPREAWVDTVDDALRLAGRQAEARRLAGIVAETRARQPELLPWLRRRGLHALELADAWPRLLAIVDWLQTHPRPGVYLRQMDLPGTDTKFVEQHRAVLGELLDLALPPEAIDAHATCIAGFARRYGFREKPVRIRLRVLDPACALLGTGTDEDITMDSPSFARLQPAARRVFITENEINFLAFPPLADGLVLFGAGYGLDVLARTPWLRDKLVYYWGDIDTHGFAILDELRAGLPHAQSFLMDRATLLAHEPHWVEEPQPARRELARLDGPERSLYDDLRWQRITPRALRLEQERVEFGCVQAALARLG